ncbi:MAG: hypothetical protein WB696_00980 [Chthoniobacterales bacterium]
MSTKHLDRWGIVRTGGTWERLSFSVAASVWRVFVNINMLTPSRTVGDCGLRSIRANRFHASL